ncbi:hypothetical protein CEXT_747661 [Caerostris extrusa]|uniref:Uncharacterized protein n=1 Tax=Caerostris extrusa TaxID=172846 RepID=A0AAV4T8W7_CAEEX|nr:hypothetical protein CEXT_747661 [Caerostris extrusa]
MTASESRQSRRLSVCQQRPEIPRGGVNKEGTRPGLNAGRGGAIPGRNGSRAEESRLTAPRYILVVTTPSPEPGRLHPQLTS